MPKEIKLNNTDLQNIIKLYQDGKSCKDIGKLFNLSKQTINKNLKNNIEIRDHSHAQQKYHVNEDIFEKIDSYEKAYWLGMLTGDGWITNKNEIGLSLQEKDKEHVYKFRDFLQSNHPINVKHNKNKKDGSPSISYELRFTNKKIVSNLRNHGFTPNKTHFIVFPKLEDKFLSNYMLGLIDSDGSFNLKLKYNDHTVKTLSFSFIGPTKFVEDFQMLLIKKCSITQTLLDTPKTTNFVRVLNYGGYKNIYKIVKFLYSDSPIWLKRKKEIAINYLLIKYPNDQWLSNQSTSPHVT